MFQNLTPAGVTVIGAAIVLVSSLAASITTNIFTIHSEGKKWERQVDLETQKTNVAIIGKIYKILAQGYYEVVWMTWHAKYIPARLTDDTVDNYDRQMKMIYQECISLLARIKLSDEERVGIIKPHVDRLWVMDVHLSIAAKDFKTDRQKAIQNLSSIHSGINQMFNEFMDQFRPARTATRSSD